jgi:uncharacterized circularly permuted ATP-grasp superfamily protein
MVNETMIEDKGIFNQYQVQEGLLDEVFLQSGQARKHYQKILNQFYKFSADDFKGINEAIKISFFNQGVTFNVYSDKSKGVERIFPFDLFPRIMPKREWEKIEKGVIQRNKALNLFLQDLYSDQKILKDKAVPSELIYSSAFYNKHMLGFKPKAGVFIHVAGTDLIKHKDGEYYVLEDNVRCPSGVSYVVSNRLAMKKTLPSLFKKYKVSPVEEYPEQLLAVMQSVAPEGIDNPTCVVLTPGVFNSAYYEHSFLALSMGIQVVEGRDLFVDKNFVYMKTIYGPKRVDVIYRRVDDDFLDPLFFRPDSLLGVPGLMGAYKDGNVTLVNAPGTGVSDDKAVYTYMPEIIKYYLGETQILKNVRTYKCENESDYKFVMENMHELVIKPVDESGGYGIMIGNRATKQEIEDYKKLIAVNRRKYIAQPIMSLSVHSTFIDDTNSFEPRHIDLRTFSLMGNNYQYVLKGGLTRVALKRGSLIVNSSQGGGSKDSWVLEE